MKRITAFFKKLRIGQILTVFLAGVLLFTSTACNPGNAQGARPNNPPVQMGGNNNPHTAGGDGYTNYRMSTDPKVNSNQNKSQGNRADLQLISPQLIAAQPESEMLYPGAETPTGLEAKERELPKITLENFTQPEPGGLNQRNQDLGERIGNRLEAVKETFGEASEFLQDKAQEAGARPEMKRNPALEK